MSPKSTPTRRRRNVGRSAAVVAAMVLTAGVTMASGQVASAASAPVAIDILTINDFHGRLEANGAVAGAAVLAGAVDDFRAKNPNTLFVSAGDNIGASTFTSFIQDDQPTLDALNAMKLDVSSVGNHEFDKGSADLTGRVSAAADFPYLAANVVDKATGKPIVDPYYVKEVDGIKVGFIGAVTEELPSLVSPAGISTVTVEPIVPAVNAVADALTDGDPSNGEADVVVLLVHEGAPTSDVAASDSVFGGIVDGVDANVSAIVSAHTHQLYNYEAPVPGVAGATRPVLQAASYGMDLGHLSLSVDPDTKKLLSITSEVLPLVGPAPALTPLYPADPAVTKIVSDAVAVAKVEGQKKVGEITADFTRAKQSDGSENRGGESTLGNFVADVQLSSAQQSGAQVAFMNPGGLRSDLTYASSGAADPDGNVTFQEAAAVQPFANTLVTAEFTGAQIREVLEQQWQPAGASRSFLKLGVSKDLTYTYDPTAPAGSHIRSVMFEGSPLGDDDTLKVVMNSFLASGGDNFFELAKGANAADSGKIDLQSMVDYFATEKTASPDDAQRAIGAAFETAAETDAGYRAGQTVTVALSSLLLSPLQQPATVSVLVDGVVVGLSPIDPSVVDTTDEVGRATVTFTIPETAAKGAPITIAVSSTSTVAEIARVGEAAGATVVPVPPGGGAGSAPVLANTGAPTGEFVGVGAFALASLLAGAGMMVLRRRRALR